MRHCLPFILMVCVACSTSPKQKAEVEPLDAEFIPAASHDNGWQKRGEGPVLGNHELGTCFDVNVIPDGSAKYNMYFSWRPKKAIALSRSEDGVTWTDPKIVLEYDEASTLISADLMCKSVPYEKYVELASKLINSCRLFFFRGRKEIDNE